jgi:GT2 family glycosyltransferase
MFAYTVVIPTRNRSQRAHAAVEGVLGQTRGPTRIVLVDASDAPIAVADRTRAAVSAAGAELVVLNAPASTAGQRNRGVEAAQTPLVLLLDDDVSLQADYVEVLLERWQREGLHAFAAMVGAAAYMPHQSWAQGLLRRALMLHYQAPRGQATAVRRSGKLRLVAAPAREVTVPVCGAGFALFRTDLLRRHRFDERFDGYAPGEDLDLSIRIAGEAPILQVPSVRYTHEWDPRERTSAARWERRGRCETYFRLRHLDSSRVSCAAFAISLLAETAHAAAESVLERDLRHLVGFVRGVRAGLREHRSPRTHAPLPGDR